MGLQGLFLDYWSLYFSPNCHVPTLVLVWVKLPFLPLHYWNDATFKRIDNALLKYIDCIEPCEGIFSCALICVEVDIDKGIPTAINLYLDNWSHIQEVITINLPSNANFVMSMVNLLDTAPKRKKIKISMVI